MSKLVFISILKTKRWRSCRLHNEEDKGATVVKYDVVRKNNKVRINKIYPVMMAD